MPNKPKEIIEFIESIIVLLQKKRDELEKDSKDKPFGALEHTNGQLYEAQYILDNVWDIVGK